MSDFISQMEYAYAAADMVISRSGAMAIAELCIVRKPVVFVPNPHAAENHQTVNAMHLVNREAALMVPDAEVLNKLVPTLIQLSGNQEAQETLKKNIAKLAIDDADLVVAGDMLHTISKKA